MLYTQVLACVYLSIHNITKFTENYIIYLYLFAAPSRWKSCILHAFISDTSNREFPPALLKQIPWIIELVNDPCDIMIIGKGDQWDVST